MLFRESEFVNEDTWKNFDKLGPISISSTNHATRKLTVKNNSCQLYG
jgi:hypothetical protein